MEGKQPTERELRLEIEGLQQQLARLQATVAKRDGEISAYESLTKSIFSQTDQALVGCDSRGRIIRASQAAHRLAGRDLLGLYFHEAFALKLETAETIKAKGAKSTADPLAADLAGEIRQGLEATLRREDGRVFHLRMNVAPTHETQGQTRGALVIFQDISELKESERQRQNLLEEVEAQAEKLAVDDEELTVQAKELRVQNEELQALMVRLEVQREEVERATEELEAERALLRTVLEQMPGGVIIAAAPTGKFLLVNRQMSKILGHPLSLEDSLKNYSHYRLLYPDGRPLPTEEYPLARALAVGRPTKEEEIDFYRDDGAIRTLRVSAEPIRDRLGRIIAGVATYTDISERKLAEKALVRAKEEWELTFNSVPDLIAIIDRKYRIVRVNRTMAEVLGAVPEDLEGRACHEIIHNSPGPPPFCPHSRLMADGREHVAEVHELDRIFLESVSPLADDQGNLMGSVHVARDITARKQAEAALQRAHDELEQRVTERTAELKSTVEQLQWEVEERQRMEASLRESEAMFRGTFDQSPVGAFIEGLDYRYNRVNEAFCRITGYSEAELLSLRFSDITHPDDLEEDMAQARRLAAGDLDRSDREKRYLRKDGQATWVRLTMILVSDARGRPRHYLGIVQDINARKQAETALAVEKQRLTSVLEQIPAYVALVKPDHTIPFANREFIRRFGEPGTNHCYEFFSGSPEPCENCQTFETLHTKSPVHREWAGPDGNTYEIYDYPYTDIDGSPLILQMGVDITARKEAEDQLRRQTAILEAINRVFRESLSCDKETELGRICLTMAEELTGSQHGFICELNPQGKLDVLAFSDMGWEVCKLAAREPDAPREVSVKGLNLRVIQEGCSLMVNEPASHPEAAGFLEGQPSITSFLATPLKMAGRVIGFIGLANKAEGYTERDQVAVEMLARAIVEVLMRFRAEKKAVSITRLYRLVSKVNEAIVRAADQDVLFLQVCRIAVEEGLFKMAWIGLADPKSQSVKALAQYGLEEGYLEKIKISLKGAESFGPTGTAVREGRYDICNDIITDPRMAPWQQQALESDYRSSGAFPLRVGSQVMGALTIYSDQRGFFTEEEISLLDSLAQDVSFAMESFDRETKRRQAVAALQESEERLRLLAAQLIAAQESERKRIAIELHDDLGQSLMVLKMQVREIAKLLPADSQQNQELSIQVLDYIDGVVENVRRLSRDLMPSILEDLGLTLAIKQLLENFCKYHEIECSLVLEDIQGQFTPEQEIIIYRIFQESLTNIAKHAQTSQVRVNIRKGDDSIYFSLEDNGRGFDLEEFLAAGLSRQCLGLASMEERVRMLNGILAIWSQVGQGTRITFQVPLRQP